MVSWSALAVMVSIYEMPGSTLLQELDEMKGKIDVLVAHNRRLAEYVADVDTHKRQMFAQMGDLRRRWSQTISDNVRLQAELAALKQAKV